MRMALSLLALSVSASDIASDIDGLLKSDLPLDGVRVVLNGSLYSGIPREDRSFCIHSVRPGTYLLEVHDVQSIWQTAKVEVSSEAAGRRRAILGPHKMPVDFPLPLEPLVAQPVFFEKREGFQWWSLLMNPMVLMMGVTLLIMFVLPKMMANMDPEQLKEMQQMQGGFADMLNPEKLKEKQQQQLKEKRKERRD